MAFWKRNWRSKRIAKRKTFRKKIRKTGKNKLVTKSQLYRAIRRNVETKVATALGSFTGYNSAISATGDFQTLLPTIAQGTGQNQRIGVKVKPLKLVIRGYWCYNSDAISNNVYYQQASMLGVRHMIFQDKTTKFYSNGIYNYNLLDAGGAPTTYNGTVINHLLPHNSDQFHFFYDKSSKILKPFGYTNSVTSLQANDISSFHSSMYHPFVITLTAKDMPANLIFDDTPSSSNYPLNFAPHMALGYCDLMNKSADTAVTRVAMDWTATLYYEDA